MFAQLNFFPHSLQGSILRYPTLFASNDQTAQAAGIMNELCYQRTLPPTSSNDRSSDKQTNLASLRSPLYPAKRPSLERQEEMVNFCNKLVHSCMCQHVIIALASCAVSCSLHFPHPPPSVEIVQSLCSHCRSTWLSYHLGGETKRILKAPSLKTRRKNAAFPKLLQTFAICKLDNIKSTLLGRGTDTSDYDILLEQPWRPHSEIYKNLPPSQPVQYN